MNKNIFNKLTLLAIALGLTLALESYGDPVAHWRFGSSGEGRFEDLTGSNPEAKIEPGVHVEGIKLEATDLESPVEAITFTKDGVGWVSAPITNLASTDTFTLELWVRPTSPPDDQGVILGNRSGVLIVYRPNGTISFMLATEGKGWASVSLPGMLPGEWHHIAVRCKGGEMQLLVESRGELRRSPVSQRTGAWAFDWKRTVLGLNEFSKKYPFCGQIAALKIYQEAISEESFQQSKP